MKITKDVSAHLFKYVKKVDVSFNPFDSRTRSARELLRQIHGERIKKSNPKMKIIVDVNDTINPPSVKFEYVDGTNTEFDSQSYDVNEMLMEVHALTSEIDMNFELEGKNIDDM